jgi:23S rRNA (adenine2503-C2)-methyltransferase
MQTDAGHGLFAAAAAPGADVARVRRLLLLGRDEAAIRAERPRAVRRLEAQGPLLDTTVLSRADAADGAVKLLVGLADGRAVETVVLPTPRGVSVCISAQVGCPVGCLFCASGAAGLERNLAPHEIVEQLVHARRVNGAVDRMVVMGIGEPLLNAPALFAALDVFRSEGGIGPRRVVVSTVGVPGGIRKLGAYGRRVSLALSLHAPDDALRARLVPGSRAPIAALLADAEWYLQRTRNKAIAAYTLLAGVNDSDEHARRTGALLAGRQIYLNCIPWNPVPGAGFEPVPLERARRFTAIVRRHGAFATVRRTLGALEHAACGQLRPASFLAPVPAETAS